MESPSEPRCRNCTQVVSTCRKNMAHCSNCGFWMERIDGVWKLLPVREKKT